VRVWNGSAGTSTGYFITKSVKLFPGSNEPIRVEGRGPCRGSGEAIRTNMGMEEGVMEGRSLHIGL